MAADGGWVMNASDAEALAETVRRAWARQVTVEPEDGCFPVVVPRSDSDTVTLGSEDFGSGYGTGILGT